MVIRATLLVPVAVLLVACATPGTAPSENAAGPGTATSTTAPAEPTSPAATVGVARSAPTEVRVPRIDARSSLVPLGLNPDRTVEVPPIEQPMQAGWYSHAPTPGEVGPAVILGHVDGNNQPGIFHRLREVVVGDEVLVSREDGGTLRFVVRRVDQVPKDEFPTDAVYGDTAVPELRLITCGGSFDSAARSYRDNVIVYAALA
ncbi:class F sortase [Saccharothrix hoggarensis]|uniref:Class F sortase n=1 Tax=Saccharothrix hoggarensis TaxID=913853 RepID=A0ABW3QTH4_9PSEU